MFRVLPIALFATSAHATLHHLIAGTTNGQALYSLEMDDSSRSVYFLRTRDAFGSSPSLALDVRSCGAKRERKHLFSSRPANGTLTRYSIESTYDLIDEGTMDIQAACNTTNFTSIHLTSAAQNSGIWGSASTGTCSVLFGLTTDGYTQLHSKEIPTDIHSLAWAPNGHTLHALDSHASTSLTTSILNFRISPLPTLEDIVRTDTLSNVSSASQIVAHPTTNRIYIVTKHTNELITAVLETDGTTVQTAQTPSRYKVLPSILDASLFHTSSLALTASGNILYTLSHSTQQAVITAFSLNATTGAIIDAVARATWAGDGEGSCLLRRLRRGMLLVWRIRRWGVQGGVDGHEYLQEIGGRGGERGLAAKVKSYGRIMVEEFGGVGESVWVD
ncbi:hypothetical protein GQ44DRAFT_731040 [Phaeosphaeriaceae sp. PMI808]|nr:hypothetical protein GQ44DRAFT_731040 [Phaeosphaeriaceae sp. PMI808]